MQTPVRILITVFTLNLIAGITQAGPRWETSEDSYIQLNMLGQVHGSFTDDAADETDIYLRRARVVIFGQVFDGVKFFMETDNDNAGRNGVSGVSTDIQDAFVEQRLAEDHYVQGGLLLLPFSFENASSAASLLGLDYNLETLKFAETFAWRDYGVIFRGALGQRVAYRIGAFDGYDNGSGTQNADADLRVTGHIAVGVVGDADNGWFFAQERLKDEAYLNVGIGVDQQDKASLIGAADPADDPSVVDSEAFVADFQSGFPVADAFVTLNGAWHTWENAKFDGDTAFVEAGVRRESLQVVGKYSLQEPDGASSVDDQTLGLYHFRKSHNARAGIEYRWGDSPDQILIGFQVAL